MGWVLRLAKALEPLHALGVAHGKISAEAVGFDGPQRSARGVLAGAAHAPDVAAFHSPERGAGRVTPEADTWAAAVLLYLALTGRLPFPGDDDREVRRKIFGPPPAPLAVFDAGDEVLQGLLDRAFHRTASKRLTSLRELREALEDWHPDPAARSLPPLEDADGPIVSKPPEGDRATPVTPANPARAFATPSAEIDDEVTRVRAFPVAFEMRDGVYTLIQPEAAPAAPAPAPARPQAPARAAVPPPAFAPVPEREAAFDGDEGAEAGAEGPGAAIEDEVTPVSTRPDAITLVPEVPLEALLRMGDVPTPAMKGPGAAMPDVPTPAMRGPDAPTPVVTLADGRKAGAAGDTAAPIVGAAGAGDVAGPPDGDAAGEGPSEQSVADKPVVLNQPVPAAPAAAASPGVGEPEAGPPAGGKPAGGGGRWVPVVAGLAIAAAAAGVFVFRQRLFPAPDAAAGAGSAAIAAPPGSGAQGAAAGADSAAGASNNPPPGASNNPSPGADSAAPGADSAAPDASNNPSPDASNNPSPDASGSAASGAGAAAGGAGASACLAAMFPPDTFVEPPPGLNAACQITDPRKGAELIRAEVILAGQGRRVSDGMREWAVLGWYDMAAFAILRASCCPSADPVALPEDIPTCKIDASARQLASLATSPAASDADLEAAFDEYTKAARCISRAGGAGSYGRKGPPQGGEDTTFKKTLARVREAAKKKP